MESGYTLFDNTEELRYEFRGSDKHLIPRIDYFVTPHGVVYLTHTEVPSELAGRGLATALVLAVFRELDREQKRIVPVCPYLIAYLQRHPEWQHLLADGFSV